MFLDQLYRMFLDQRLMFLDQLRLMFRLFLSVPGSVSPDVPLVPVGINGSGGLL
jgi:hypothetical protein